MIYRSPCKPYIVVTDCIFHKLIGKIKFSGQRVNLLKLIAQLKKKWSLTLKLLSGKMDMWWKFF